MQNIGSLFRMLQKNGKNVLLEIFKGQVFLELLLIMQDFFIQEVQMVEFINGKVISY